MATIPVTQEQGEIRLKSILSSRKGVVWLLGWGWGLLMVDCSGILFGIRYSVFVSFGHIRIRYSVFGNQYSVFGIRYSVFIIDRL
jgi:hypothetical protein